VQIPVLISALDRPAFDRTQLCLLLRRRQLEGWELSGCSTCPGVDKPQSASQQNADGKCSESDADDGGDFQPNDSHCGRALLECRTPRRRI